MATKNAHDAAKKKTAKEKKMLVGLIVVLVLALGYAYKTMTKLHGSAAPTQVVAASSTTTPSAAAPTTPSTPASSSSSSSSTPVDVPSSGTPASSGSPASNVSDSLVSAITPPLDQGELKSFTLFAAKDPFDSGGPSPTGASSGATGGTTSTQQPTQSSSPSKPSSTGPKTPAAAPTSAVISVNGTMGEVSVGQSFPTTGDPTTDGMFQLVSLTKDTAQVAVAGGSFASGSPTLTLHVDRPVTLQNTADGTRYTLELFPQGTVAPVSAPTSSPTSSSGTSTTPTTPDTSTTPSP